MALPGYNSKEGHETPSLLDTVISAVGGAWETGTNWLEEKGTEFLENDYLKSHPANNNPYKEALKEGKSWADLTEEEQNEVLAGGEEMTQTAFDWMGGGIGRIVRKGGEFILPKIAELGKESAKKTKLGPLRQAQDDFRWSSNVDLPKMFHGITDEKQVVDIWNKARHQMSNYEALNKNLTPRQQNAFKTGLFNKVIRDLEAKGEKFAADVIRKKLMETRSNYW
jgi:hypothetical protein